MKKIVILISGRGSNMEALIAARDAGQLPVDIAAVISNRPDAMGLETAARAGITAHFIDHKAFAGREAFDAALAECIDSFAPDLVVLAGFMRILKGEFLRVFANRVVNIHPSLLPAFPGLESWKQALDYGVKFTGCTVHFVDQGVDTGPIIAQQTVPVLTGDTAETLHQRIQQAEWELYPKAVGALARGAVRTQGRQTIWKEK